jgi:tetratricopeptide (TPR) repeat protein
MLSDLGKYSEALKYHWQALEIRLQCFSEVHPDTAKSYSHIGWNYEKLEDLNKARHHYDIALRIKEQVLPQGHPELEETQENLYRVDLSNRAE